MAEAPHLYIAHQLSDNAAVGLGIYGMFGSATSYDDEWVGRFHATDTEITGININPAFAFEVSDSLSIGMGVMIQRLEGRFDSQIDVGYLVADEVIKELEDNSLVFEGSCAGTFSYDKDCIVETLAHNHNVDNSIQVDSWGYGFSFGILYEPDENTRVGFDYRSSISHLGEGEAKRPQTEDEQYMEDLEDAIGSVLPGAADLADFFSGDNSAGDGVVTAVGPLGAQGGDVQTSINMPEIVTLSLYQRIFDSDWAVTGGVTWTNWSRLDEIRFEYTDDSARGGSDITGSGDDVRRRDLVQPFDWEDTWRYGIGFIYDGLQDWVLRFGASYDESPVPDETRRTARGPDNDRRIFAVGFSWNPTERVGLDFAYTYTDFEEADINNRENPAGTEHRMVGTYDSHIHSLGAQFNYRF